MKKTFVALFVMLSMLWSMGTSAQTLVFHLIDGTTTDIELSSSFRMYNENGKTIISLADGSTKEFAQNDILSVTYRETKGDVNRDNTVDVADIASIISIMAGENTDTPATSNSVLSSRLKDMDGNPIQLTFVGNQRNYDENNGYDTRYVYNENGTLSSFGMLPDTRCEDSFFIDDLSYHSYSTLPEYTNDHPTIDVNMTLNADGYVSSLSYIFKQMIQQPQWCIADLYKGDYTLLYNQDKQLVRIEGNIHYEDNENRKKGGTELLTLTLEEGNLVKVDRIYTEKEDVEGEGLSYPFSFNIGYGNEENPLRQFTKGLSDIRFFWGEWGIEELFMIGLFGVGPVNLPIDKKEIGDGIISSYQYSYIINDNGTIHSETQKERNNSDTIIYVYN